MTASGANSQGGAGEGADGSRDRALLQRLLEIQERERQLVSYEIHDGIAQYLAGAIMHFQAWEAALGDHPGAGELREGMRLLRAAADESRRLIGGLRPPALDELGIVEAIEVPGQRFCLGMQWHPEFLIDEAERRIFQAFVEACTGS